MPDPANTPGERRLSHPPSDRYEQAARVTAPDDTPAATQGRRLTLGLIVALAGAAVIALLGGLATVTAGLVVVAAATGWAIGAVLPRRPGSAVGLAVIGVALGQAGLWTYALSQGGVLGPLDLLWQVYGGLVPVEFLAATIPAWIAAR
jgi:hypothetical protein